ncbi:MAG: hypothetical protein HN921_14280 [Bacteroidetes bacterium]|nr:hypothetical protein [Bacteroidota bacterium]
MALDYIEEDFLCFLDDDNEFSNIHILSLFNLIQLHSLEAAHSIRYLVYSDGSLYSGDFFPWHPDSIRATEIYKWCIHNRVLRVGSPIIYDGVVISDDPNNFACVDMNEWLFRTEIIQKIGFDTKFTKFDEQNMVGEDDKLLSRILEEGVNFTSSYLPTVKYSLGGFSNMKSTEI